MPMFDQFGSNNPREKKYSKLLNNLLEIKVGDSCLYSKITAANYDLFTKIGEEQTKDFLIKNEHKIIIKDLDIENLIKKLKIIKQDFKEEIAKVNFENAFSFSIDKEENNFKIFGQKAIEAYEEFNHPLSKVTKEAFSNLTEISPLNEAIVKLEQDRQRSLDRWRRVIKLVDDKQNLTNLWPLYIASGFITINFGDGRYLNAPLLLKMARLEIKGSSVNFETYGDWILNEKLIYFLKNHDIIISEEIETRDRSFLDLMNEILPYLQLEERPLAFYNSKFKNYKKEEINNKNVELKSGVMLGLFYPSGGYLREWMQKIIANDEIDDILTISPNKWIYEKNVYDTLENNYGEIVKIQESNYTQDKALISALQQDTIIWGPPGTGKSQVIANLITNVLYNQKTAVVMSEKKAALDVLRKRLKGLSQFVFFYLYDPSFSKETFYAPLRTFIKTIENFKTVGYRQGQELISHEQVEAIKRIDVLKKQGKYQAVIQAYKNTSGNFQKIRSLANVDPFYNYPININEQNEFVDLTGKLSNIPKNGYIFWWKYPDSFVKKTSLAFNVKKTYEVDDLNQLIKPFKTANFEEMAYLAQIPNLLEYSYQYKDDEQFLINFLADKVSQKLNKKYNENNKEQFKKYDRFRSAINSGRRVPEGFVDDHREIIQDLFPVIVTTPTTIFPNWTKESFDYAIIDEASQMFLEHGLPIMYLSKIKILAGDPEQMQPSSWFSTRDIADEEDEADNAENAISVLDYAKDKGVYEIMLDQNYRSSSASLMSFSSARFYESKLEVINDYSFSCNKPIEVINVNGQWDKGTNKVEALEVIRLLKEFSPLYKTIIVLAFNIKQKQLIEDMLRDEANTLWDKRVAGDKTITIRNIENIQGDEADLVIASVVYDSTTKVSGTYVARAGTGKNALNVAISRAKNKMIVVKSVDSNTINSANSEDFLVFKEWLNFLDLKDENQKTYSTLKDSPIQYGDFDSTFEEDVYLKLKQELRFAGLNSYEISRQYPIGSKKLDFAILQSNKKFILGIEVDGYDYHLGLGIDKYLEDKSREDFIKAKGYKLVRVSEIKWYLNPNEVVQNIQATLNTILTTNN